jgi:glycosyltransferase involved in cell wall biosynthesis
LLSSREVIRNGKIVTVTYGFNKESYLKRKRNIINITNNVNSKAIKIGCVARLSEEKNHITLFRAVKQLKDDNYDVILYLAGEGDYRHHLEKETDILGITANVLFLGKIDYIPDLISAMDLLVLPSIFEGFGMIIMEALANEKVIICANNSAMSEILESDLPDTLFKTFDYLDLANKILKHSAKPSEENYNQRFNLILSRFSSEIMNQKILNIYNSILNTNVYK